MLRSASLCNKINDLQTPVGTTKHHKTHDLGKKVGKRCDQKYGYDQKFDHPYLISQEVVVRLVEIVDVIVSTLTKGLKLLVPLRCRDIIIGSDR